MSEDYIHMTRSYISAAQGSLAFPSAKNFVAAVSEVENNIQAPNAIIYMSALSAIALAVQSVCDVKTPIGSIVPLSLMTLVLGDSGERKSSVLDKFLMPFRDIQRREGLEHKRKLEEFSYENEVWLARKKILVSHVAKSIDEASKSELIDALQCHVKTKPVAPAAVKFVYEDSTSQALFKGLSDDYPYAGLVTSEGKEILGGRAFNDLPKQNSLWSGDDVTIDRVNAGRFVVSGARLTVAMMVQGELFKDYLKRRGQAARASGLWARFIVVDPDSTQGTRFIESAVQNWNSLEVFNNRIKEIADEGIVNYRLGGGRKVLAFSREAIVDWTKFFNWVEGQISNGGCFERAPDHASKLVENVTRVAALISYFEYGDVPISRDCLRDAVDFCLRCSSDFKKLFVSATREEREAETLMLWLSAQFDSGVTKIRLIDLLRLGPYATRKSARLDLALSYLRERRKIDVWREDGRKYIGKADVLSGRIRKRFSA